ncbi:MAG TPA: DUF4129 domain-containing protein [Blastocatellia bacterium]
MRLRANQFYFAVACLVSLCALHAPAYGISTVGDYENRLALAEMLVNGAFEGKIFVWQLDSMASEVKRLLPVGEEVEFNGSITRVDNAWLHEALNDVIKATNGDAGQRIPMLGEISARLARLRQSVKAAQTTEDQLQDQRARLDGILARAEYQPEEKRDSVVARFINKVLKFIAEILAKLFGGSAARASQPAGLGLAMVLRSLLLLILVAAVIFGLFKLSRLIQTRKKPAEEAGPREALGEVIAESATAADLFAMASDLARQGEYRKAIRRAYIALLCDFDRRGKLRLGRSKTNRDYLDAMRSEQGTYPTFSVMTFAFERAWYGQNRATEEDFQNFVTLYQEAIK